MFDLLKINKATIKNIINEANGVKTFTLCPEIPIYFKPGQFIMLSVYGVGESPFAISSNPSDPLNIEISVQKVGTNTTAIHELSIGETVWLRGPYGNGFPIDEWSEKDIYLIAGGMGIAPIRSLLLELCNQSFQQINLLYGARNLERVIYKKEFDQLQKNVNVQYIFEQPANLEKSGFVTELVKDISIDPAKSIIAVCGPELMVKSCQEVLNHKGVHNQQIFVSLEMKMKCGIGKCGRCNINHKYVCKDGPVFNLDSLLN